MRVLYINADDGIPLFSGKGAAVHVRDFVRAATALGHSAHVLTARSGEVEPGWTVPFDAVPHGQLRRAFAEARVTHGCDLVYERYSLRSHAGLACARRLGLPFVLEVNSPLVVEQARYRTLERAESARRIERYLFAGATRIVAVSAEVADYVCAHGADPRRVVVVSNGVDLSLYGRHGQRRETRGRFTVAFLGSLKPWHGLEVLVDALALLVARDPSYHLRVVGDGPERAALERRLSERGLSRHATVVGQVARRDVPAHLNDADCAVAPYPRLEGFYFSPLKVFEYMAAGCPIVASRIGQIESVLTDRETALLVEPGSAAALADAVGTLRTQPAVASSLADAARRRAHARHGWQHAVAAALHGLTGAAA